MTNTSHTYLAMTLSAVLKIVGSSYSNVNNVTKSARVCDREGMFFVKIRLKCSHLASAALNSILRPL